MATRDKGVSRRRLLTAGGATLAGSLFLGRSGAAQAPARAAYPSLVARGGGPKSVFLAPQGTSNVAVLSHADNVFWTDIMMEHAGFIGLFLAGPELVELRSRAASYQGMFAGQLARLQSSGAEAAYQRMGAQSIELTKAFVDFKHELYERSRSGKIRTLAYPSFYAHAAQEGERFITRLGLLNQGQPQLERSEVVGFWSEMMADHLKLLAHMLDPSEVALIRTSLETGAKYEHWQENRPEFTDAVIAELEKTIDLTATTEKGLDAGTIQGIITPALADHHRREAVKAADELRRVSFVHATR